MEVKYLETAKKVLATAKTYLNEDWTHMSTNSQGTKLSKKTVGSSSIPCYHVEASVKKTAEYLMGKIWDVDEAIVKKNDHAITSWKQIEAGANWKVCQQTNSAPWPIWPRELVF